MEKITLEEKIFQDCLIQYKSDFTLGENWKSLAKKYSYETGEYLRSSFKNERRRRHIPGKGQMQQYLVTKPNSCKILLWDIETTPINAFVWGIWEQNVNLEGIVQDSHMLSWSAKWLFDPDIMSDVLTSREAKQHDDKRITQSLWKLLDEADVVIGHNCIQFDEKKANTSFLKHGLPPVSHFQSIDTLTVAKSVFRFSSNKLDYVNEFLGLPKKIPTSFDLWVRCYNGDISALKEMETYNRGDVEILEDLYLQLRPYIKNHPNLNLWSDENISLCPNCGSPKITWNGSYYTYTGQYDAFRCDSCGAIGRSRKSTLDKAKNKTAVR